MNGIEIERPRRPLWERIFKKKEKPAFDIQWKNRVDSMLADAEENKLAARFYNIYNLEKAYGFYFSLNVRGPYTIVFIDEKGPEEKTRKAIVSSEGHDPKAFLEVDLEGVPTHWTEVDFKPEAKERYLKNLLNSSLYTGAGTLRWGGGWPEAGKIEEAMQRREEASYS